MTPVFPELQRSRERLLSYLFSVIYLTISIGTEHCIDQHCDNDDIDSLVVVHVVSLVGVTAFGNLFFGKYAKNNITQWRRKHLRLHCEVASRTEP